MIFATNELYDVMIFYMFVKYIRYYYTFDENKIHTFYTYVINHYNLIVISNLIHDAYNYYLFCFFLFFFFFFILFFVVCLTQSKLNNCKLQLYVRINTDPIGILYASREFFPLREHTWLTTAISKTPSI